MEKAKELKKLKAILLVSFMFKDVHDDRSTQVK